MQRESFTMSIEVALGGRLDRAAAHTLRTELLPLAVAVSTDEVVVDLSGVTHMDAAGLMPLRQTRLVLASRHRTMRLRGVRHSAELIRAAGLDGGLDDSEAGDHDQSSVPSTDIPGQRGDSVG